jgi:cobalamin biosynthesis protein CobT
MNKMLERNPDQEQPVFAYEEYSRWSRQLAEQYSLEELEKEARKCQFLSDKYARQHLAAIEATSSMQSQAQRRANARNNCAGNYEKKRAYLDAIELHRYYPERCKKEVV